MRDRKSRQRSADTTAAKAVARPRNPGWFTLAPLSLVVACAYAVGLVMLPVAGGDILANDVIMETSWVFATTFLFGMLAAWFFWRLARRSNMIANTVFCAVIVGSAVLTMDLAGPRRSQAEVVMEPIVEPVFDAISELLD
ncbi:MAG: hypothetical protein ACYTF9_00905 [Planctomycetota bacterium]|jgi:uncharacterized membrane protein